MPVRYTQSTKRAFICLLTRLAIKYKLDLDLMRDPNDADVRKLHRKVSRKVHPDRGGSTEDQKKLNVAHDAWEKAVREAQGKNAVDPC